MNAKMIWRLAIFLALFGEGLVAFHAGGWYDLVGVADCVTASWLFPRWFEVRA